MSERPENRLAHEASPYLRQHGHNPVDWYPWGPEALERAKGEGKPILLSIGYSACHWCHVMERESFEDPEIARQMNEGFVCIKVDREERPDLDHVYQLVLQLMGRSGGWPLTVFLTPDQRPFFGGTYFPPVDRWGVSGFPKVLAAVLDAYRTRPEDVLLHARELTEAIEQVGETETRGREAYSPGPDVLARAAKRLVARFDERNGGFGARPKFPNTMCIDVLLRHGALEKDEESSARVRRALDKMRAGGIWDHLGGGFHRYSTDERWLVPHFEKMLYDNALLLRLYVEGFRAFGHEPYAATASDLATYLLGEMQSPEGGFYSTTDADSEGQEGRFFVWTPAQVRAALAGDRVAEAVALAHFGITEQGNFEETGATVLHVSKPLDVVAREAGITEAEASHALTRATRAMLAARDKRVRPVRDEKIIASWNGLVIGALADASRTLGEPSLLAAAEKAFLHVEKALVDGGRVDRLVMEGEAKGPGFLEDHAFLCAAAIDLYGATGKPRYLARARAVADEIVAQFWDAEDGGFFFTRRDGEALIARTKDPFDQAIPSGASVASLALLELSSLVDEKYLAPSRRQLESLAPAAVENPLGFGQALGVIDRLVRGSTEIVVVGDASDPRTTALVDAAFAAYEPNRLVAHVDPARPETFEAVRPLAEGKAARSIPVAYVCRARACSAPIDAPEDLRRALERRA